jgi:DNA-binding transcriptional ArsR family regulator
MPFPEFDEGLNDEQMRLMIEQAVPAADFLKALAHEGRLLILCHLASGEKSVSDLEQLLHYRQAAVSQQLARLRLEGLVKYRREGKAIHYSLNEEKSRKIIELVYDLFCSIEPSAEPQSAAE